MQASALTDQVMTPSYSFCSIITAKVLVFWIPTLAAIFCVEVHTFLYRHHGNELAIFFVEPAIPYEWMCNFFLQRFGNYDYMKLFSNPIAFFFAPINYKKSTNAFQLV